MENGDKVIVGINKFVTDEEPPIDIYEIDPEFERKQIAFLDNDPVRFHLAFFQVDTNYRRTNHAGNTKLAGNHRSVGSSPTFAGQNTLGS